MRIALLISGGGTTAAAIITACRTGRLKGIEPVLVIASTPDAGGIRKAIDLGMAEKDVLVINPKNFKDQNDFGLAIIKACKERKVDFLGQYGWLCLTPSNVIQQYQGKMVNQHPGPLDIGRPDFGGKGMYGRRVHAARLLFVRRTGRDFWTEATAQRVAIEFDRGAVLKAIQVPILEDDTVETLQARTLPFEYEAQIQTLEDFANNGVKEVVRNVPLIRPEEYQILEECKKEAIKMYPKG